MKTNHFRTVSKITNIIHVPFYYDDLSLTYIRREDPLE